MPVRFHNRAIAASAGTGKTWALAHRYLALMAAGVEPERICALTFSRKAAGEIFETIVQRLCLAATQPAERDATRRSIARQADGAAVAPEQSQDYVRLLARLLDATHRLRIGTLDSFMLGIARAFPLELGIPPDTQPMDNAGAEAQARRQALLMRLYDPLGQARDAGSETAARALLEAFRQAAFGRECKGLAGRLDAIVGRRHDFYCQHATKNWGGSSACIWSTAAMRWWESGATHALASVRDAATFASSLAAHLSARKNAARFSEALAGIAATAAAHAPDRPWAGTSSVLLARLLDAAREDAAPSLTFNRVDYPLPPSLWPGLRAAIQNLVAVEIGRQVEQTAGLHALLRHYDALYREAQRRQGGLTFTDVSRLLGTPGNRPSRDANASGKLYIDYRLDGQLDHWLLDEFQDTSDDQWGAIANLVDEVVQDDSRSLFYVGDIKQSIYGWRSGNRRLFDRVRRQCRLGPAESMVDCHRSLPAIVATVNKVFERLPEWRPSKGSELGPHPKAMADFVGASWPVHRSAAGSEKGDGFAALLEYDPTGDAGEDEDAGEAPQYEAIARILADTQPIRRGLSIAVLVRSNADGRACADSLRRSALHGRCPPMAVVHEGSGGIVDNPAVTLLLALVRHAAHPGDTLARRHLQMSPLAPAAATDAADWLADLPRQFLAAAHEHGYAGALRPWVGCLETTGALAADDAFSRQRLREFLAAAEEFDATGSREPDAFAEHILACQVRAQAAADAVRVMTIHQSKGLGFDLVFVPFARNSRSFADLSSVQLLHSDFGADDVRPEGWVLQAPRRDILRAAGGPPAEALDAARAEANFEQLCVLYVALTRAKRAMILLVPKESGGSTSVREADLLRERLMDGDGARALCGLPLLYSAGDVEWFKRRVERPAEAPPEASDPIALPLMPAIRRREPSKDQVDDRPMPARWLFTEEAGDVPAFGSALHRLFERVEWLDGADLDARVAEWRAASLESLAVLRDVEAQFRRCMDSGEARACFSRAAYATGSDVWREAPFSFVNDAPDGPEIVSGRFDRLVIERASDGRPVRATVIDFKSSRIQAEDELVEKAAGYATQMRAYAAAAARLLGLESRQVSSVILFTRVGRVWQVQTFSQTIL